MFLVPFLFALVCAVAIVGACVGVALRVCLRPPSTRQMGARWGALWGLLVAGGALVMLLVPNSGGPWSLFAWGSFAFYLVVGGVLLFTMAAGALLGGALGALPDWHITQPKHLWVGLAWVAIAAAVPLGGLKLAEMEFHIKSVHQYGQTGDVDALLHKLARGRYRVERADAVSYLGQLYDGKDERIVPALIEALQEEARWVSAAAARALGEIGDERAVAALGEVLSAGDGQVRRDAVRALSKMDDERVRPLLRDALDDESEGGGPMVTKDADSLVAEGMAAKRAGKLDEAASKLEQALDQDPDNVDAHWGLAWMLASQKKNQEAIGHFQQVLELTDDPEKTDQAQAAIERLK